ncbi:MAG: SpoIIE family protein phosphatase [Acidimicrobiales bacterium]
MVDGEESPEVLRAALEAAAELYQRAPCGYLSTTPEGTIVSVNETLAALSGYRVDELVGRRTFASLLTAGGRIYHETHYAPMLQMQGVAREIALDIICADGRRLPVLVNSILERGPDGRARLIRTAVFDATDRRRYETELLLAKQKAEASEQRARQLARTLQTTLVPPSLPNITGLDLAVVFRPAGDGHQIGGDFYDVSQIGAGDWLISVGDVAGKGAEAAVVTALARYTIHSAAIRRRSPAQILSNLNAVLLRDTTTDRFCTATIIRLRQSKSRWTATVCNGGHPPPLLLRDNASATALGRPGNLIGVFDSPRLYDSKISLHSGDTIVIYTDGVTEGRHGDEFFGEGRLTDTIARHTRSAQELCDATLTEVLDFQGGTPRDDIILFAIQILDDGPTHPRVNQR